LLPRVEDIDRSDGLDELLGDAEAIIQRGLGTSDLEVLLGPPLQRLDQQQAYVSNSAYNRGNTPMPLP